MSIASLPTHLPNTPGSMPMPRTMASIVNEHLDWLHDAPRSTKEVRQVLFPSFGAPAYQERVLGRITTALTAAGFAPSDDTVNPTWTEAESDEDKYFIETLKGGVSGVRLNLDNAWVKESPRTSEEIEDALGTVNIIGGVPACEERKYLNAMLREAGYVPSSADTDNPTWTWTK